MAKVVFITTVGSEVDLFYPVYQSLVDKINVLNISTGELCCDKDVTSPEIILDKLGMRYKRLVDYHTKSAVKILKKEKPDVLIVGSDQEYLRRAFVYASNQLKIPVILFQLGISSNKSNVYTQAIKRTAYRIKYHFINILRKYGYLLKTMVDLKWSLFKILSMMRKDLWQAVSYYDIRGTFGCDYIVVSGKWEKDTLLERGIEPQKIVVTGNPLINLSKAKGEVDLRYKFDIGKDEKVILLLTSAIVEHGLWTESMREECIGNAIDILSQSGRLIIKIHPVESLEDYQFAKGKAILCKKVVLHDVINISDLVVVSGYSTTVLEATTLNKPVILLNVFNEVKAFPYEEMGLVKGIYKFADLKEAVESVLHNQAIRNEALRKIEHFYGDNKEFIDGRATERITDLILGVIK
jgi:hypothetical protein